MPPVLILHRQRVLLEQMVLLLLAVLEEEVEVHLQQPTQLVEPVEQGVVQAEAVAVVVLETELALAVLVAQGG